MDKLNLKHLKHINAFIPYLVNDFNTVTNSYLNEWVRYIKYSFNHKLFDSDMNLYIKFKHMRSVSIVYSSDRGIFFERTLEFLLKRNYLIKHNDLYYYNSEFFSETFFIKNYIEENNNYNNTLCYKNPWYIIESNKEYILFAYSEILNSITPVCFYMKSGTSKDSISLKSLKEKLICPILLQLLDKCYLFFKRRMDFINTKKIKDFYRILDNLNPTPYCFIEPYEIEQFIKEQNDVNLIELKITNGSLRVFDLFENKIKIATFIAFGPTTYETIATILLILNINNMKKLLLELLNFIDDNVLNREINRALELKQV